MTPDRVMELIEAGNLVGAEELLWRDVTQEWCSIMAPLMESAGGRYERTNRPPAVWCYEQAKALYEAESSGATSGGEGMANMMQGRGSHLGRKIWLLKS